MPTEEARERARGLKRAYLALIRTAKRHVLDAQAELLAADRRVDPQYRDLPPGWSLGASLPPGEDARERAKRILVGPPPHGPVGPSVRRLRDRTEHDRRFLEALWEGRPKLVAAVALYSELCQNDFHPDNYRQLMVEPAFRAATETIPFTADSLRMGRRYSSRRRRFERLDGMLVQLERLGWAWRVPEGQVEPKRPKGGGEPMPHWWLEEFEPAEVDGDLPDNWLGWWSFDAPRDWCGGTRTGRTLWTCALAALLDALELPDPGRNTRANRELLAAHVPHVWRDRRDTGSRAHLARTVERIQQRR